MSQTVDPKKIRAVVMDIDGVLTDGRIGYGATPGEIKFFDVKDGHAIKLMQRAGLQVGVLSGRKSEANRQRCVELGLDFAYEGEKDKGAGLEKLLAERGLKGEECLYMGDDLIDLPPMRKCGIAVAVGDAVAEVVAEADWTTRAGGGRGAVREAGEWLLKQQGKWAEVTKRYF